MYFAAFLWVAVLVLLFDPYCAAAAFAVGVILQSLTMFAVEEDREAEDRLDWLENQRK